MTQKLKASTEIAKAAFNRHICLIISKMVFRTEEEVTEMFGMGYCIVFRAGMCFKKRRSGRRVEKIRCTDEVKNEEVWRE